MFCSVHDLHTRQCASSHLPARSFGHHCPARRRGRVALCRQTPGHQTGRHQLLFPCFAYQFRSLCLSWSPSSFTVSVSLGRLAVSQSLFVLVSEQFRSLCLSWSPSSFAVSVSLGRLAVSKSLSLLVSKLSCSLCLAWSPSSFEDLCLLVS